MTMMTDMTLYSHAFTEGRVAFEAGDPRSDPGPKRDGWDAAQADLCRRHMVPPSLTPDQERKILLERARVWQRMYEQAQLDLLATRTLLDELTIHAKNQRDMIERMRANGAVEHPSFDPFQAQCDAEEANLAQLTEMAAGFAELAKEPK